MTVEIKELVIKATVAGQTKQSGEVKQTLSKSDTNEIVRLCVAEVIRILKREKER